MVSIAGAVLIVVYALASVNIRVSHIPVVRWIAMLFLMVVGAIFVITALAKRRKTDSK